ncbi:myosin light chain kinase 2, skeletal/cardiac muscle [Megalops cyprinoides]|uniref:myosin light chain kinase 2, skeletal/cardiac muscle n=1 Tax=Megalops cyprinoides TaxID=118141 RepID=UPI001863FC66|nr:myosin light chain kinase 2, skeletal/cardiac muscle [Megalops cyprinoides]
MRTMRPSVAPLRELSVLEAKVDSLERKLDQLLSSKQHSAFLRPGVCAQCCACSLHARQQEALVNILSAQARQLESLEKLVLDIHGAQKCTSPNREAEATPEKVQPCRTLPTPPSHEAGASPEKVQPCRTPPTPPSHEAGASPEKVQPCRTPPTPPSHEAGASPEKVQHCRTPPTPPSREAGPPVREPFTDAKKDVPQPGVKRNQALKQQNMFVALQKGGAPAQVKEEAKKVKDGAQRVCKALSPPLDGGLAPKNSTAALPPSLAALLPSPKVPPQPADPSKPGPSEDQPPQLKIDGIAVLKKDPEKIVSDINKDGVGDQQLRMDKLEVGACLSVKFPVQFHTEETRSAASVTDLPPDPKCSPPATLATTIPTKGEKTAPNVGQGALFGLTVPMATTDSPILRHVHSCPDSLQRIQGSGGSVPPIKPPDSVAPPLVKACDAATGPTVMPVHCSVAAGIQIRVSPAPTSTAAPGTPKTTPNTCQKIIDDDPPRPAPFPHRVVSLRPSQPCEPYSINTKEVLGGGRFGTVHTCMEKTSGLKLAAKIITARNAKERVSDMALNEIQVMNQLSHPNIIQLYDAFVSKNQVFLILEFVEGGELFERIVDESAPLTELDAMIFVKQICQGIQYMHQMYVLHLDLKPENILCVNRSGYQVKIIDFGLARRYKPRDKLRVSFGTPEFLAPEIVNFDFVSFPTDMWTLGVVTYMLLSGLSPFMGDDDSQTLNNVVAVNWYFDEEAFEHVSPEAKDFISNLLIRERSGRLSATQCLKHPWLNSAEDKAKRSNILLKSQLQLRKYMAKRLWKKNYIAIAAANRFKKISSCGSLTSLGI